MPRNPRRTTAIITVATLLLALAIGGGIWLARSGGDEPQAAPGATAPPATVAPGTTTAPTLKVMTVKVYFHERTPSAESDPRRVVPVTRTVPRSPKVATAALTELLRGPSARERAAGYWSFFSADTAGMLRGVRVDAGTAVADFHDFRRVIPNASSSYGSAALLAELDTTLGQFPTVKRTLYAFDGNVAAFYEWLQLAPPAWATTGTWRSTATAPIAGRDGAAAVWTGRQMLVWGGHGRVAGQGLRPLTDGAAYDPATNRWQRTPSAPSGMQGTSAAAVWTGSRMLVWMGNAPDGPAVGASYHPASRTWRRMAPSPLGPRESFTAVWTGRELIIFGGSSGDQLAMPAGAAYNPASDRWRLLARAPIADRLDHAAVWTGSRLLIWGGRDARGGFGDGAAYDPGTNLGIRSPGTLPRPSAAPPGPAPGCWCGLPPAGAPPAGPSTTRRVTGGRRSRAVPPWVPTTRDRCGPAPSWWPGPVEPAAAGSPMHPRQTAGRSCRAHRSPAATGWAPRWCGPAARW
jgi:hypothetical protein